MPHKLLPPGSRGPCWYLRGTDAGGRFEVSTGKETRKDAEGWADRYLLERARQRVPGTGETVGFSDAARFYKAFANLTRLDERLIDRVAAHFQDTDCRTIVHAQIVGAAEALLPGRSASTKNRKVIGPTAAVLHYAAGQRWCEYQRLAKFKVSRKSSRTPARDEDVAKLMANVEQHRVKKRGRKKDRNVAHKRLLLAMLYETGLRLGHLLAVGWPDIDLTTGRIRVRIAKSDETASVPISSPVVVLLANLPTKTGRLFPWSTNRGVYGWLKPLTDKLGITYTPHMSRHALATAAADAQIPDKKAAELGVWQDARSLHRYQHVRPEAIAGRDAGALLNRPTAATASAVAPALKRRKRWAP